MRRILSLALLLIVTAAAAARADGFSASQRAEIVAILRDALVRDPSILRDAVAALQRTEAEDGARQSSAAIARLGPELYDRADPIEGNPRGDVTVVEFFDTRCPYCRRMLPTVAELLREEPNIKVALKDTPILGPTSQLESRALLAAQRQGGYLKLRDAIMTSAAPTTRDTLRPLAESVGLDSGQLMRDLDDPAVKTRLERNVALAGEIGIGGTPAMVIGTTLISGAADLPELRAAIAAARVGR